MSAPTLTRTRSYVANVLAAATVGDVTAALYLSPDYRPGDLHRQALELVEVWAMVELRGLTPADVAATLSYPSDPARLTDCRAAAREVLAAQ